MRLRGGGITRSITVRRIAQRRRRRADVQDQQPAHREDRGRAPRRRPPRAALLPAQARRQGRDAARAPPERLTAAAPRPPTDDPADRRGRSMSGALRCADGRRSSRPSAASAPSGATALRPGRRRRRGRRGPDVRPRRRGGRDHAARRHRIPGVRDSKTLSAAQRERLAPIIRRAGPRGRRRARRRSREIDRLNIYHATHLAMRRASPGSAATTTSSSTATGSPGSRSRSGRTRAIVDGDASSTRSPAPRSSPRSSATG